jgi:hypothetical protein
MKKLAAILAIAALPMLGGCVVYGTGPAGNAAWANYDHTYDYGHKGYDRSPTATASALTRAMAAVSAPAMALVMAAHTAAGMAACRPTSMSAAATAITIPITARAIKAAP